MARALGAANFQSVLTVIDDADAAILEAETLLERSVILRPALVNAGAMHWPANPKNILVLGGSVTAGGDVGGKKHAWPMYVTGIPTILNRAVGGTGSNYAFAEIDTLTRGQSWDIIMLEYAVNDDDIGVGKRYGNGVHVVEAFESLIRTIRIRFPSAMIIVIECFRPRKKPAHGFTSGQTYHDLISKYYQLPVISIRDAIWHVWNDAEPDSALAKMFPKHRSHPTVDGQKLIAHIVSSQL
jgi:hypothetical protein